MNLLGNTLAALVVLASLATLGAGGYLAFDFVLGFFASLEPQAARVTVLASIVALFAAAIVARSIRQAASRIRASTLSVEKSATYRLFIEQWESLLSERRRSADRGPAESEDLRSLDLLLVLYGSPAVIKAHAALRGLYRESRAQNHDMRPQFAKALVEIRKDLGSHAQGIVAEELQQLLIPASDEAQHSTGSNSPRLGGALGSNP
jgi:hypothetical protein